jgi:hypothetical protein
MKSQTALKDLQQECRVGPAAVAGGAVQRRAAPAVPPPRSGHLFPVAPVATDLSLTTARQQPLRNRRRRAGLHTFQVQVRLMVLNILEYSIW